MTNDTKAPARLWAVFEPHHSGKGPPYVHASASPTKGVPYIPENHALSLVAAAYEDAAQVGADIAERQRPDGMPYEASMAYHTGTMDAVDAIRSCTPADAQAALEARDKRIREEALWEAANIAKEIADQYVGYMSRIEKATLAQIDAEPDKFGGE